jgi:hypothetical protein
VTELHIHAGHFDLDSDSGAAIGSGFATGGNSTVEDLLILDGRFEIGSQSGAGIGSGATEGGSSTVNELMITGGYFSVVAMTGAAIGSGAANAGTSCVESLKLSYGTFSMVVSEEGAGIGAGHSKAGVSVVQELEISGGVYAPQGMNGAAVGTGLAEETGLSHVEICEISGGVVGAQSSGAAAIGTGQAAGQSLSKVSKLTISGGHVTAIGVVGIGAVGVSDTASAVVEDLIIDGVTIRTVGDQGGIGSGLTGSVASITFLGENDLNCSSATGCLRADTVNFGDTSISAFVTGSKLLSSSYVFEGHLKLYIQYGTASEREGFTDVPSLHLASIKGLYPSEFAFAFWSAGKVIAQHAFDAQESQGLFVLLPNSGEYSVSFTNASGVTGWLSSDAGITAFKVGSSEDFESSVRAVIPSSPPLPSGGSSAGTTAAIILGVLLAAVIGFCITYYFMCLSRTSSNSAIYDGTGMTSFLKEDGHAYI